ncbi:FixH family protein [Bacillus weihaiensis]|uniref:YtkA-like domain-containing protein n=1 Tax=Bacillus weihaiensis TaxID=1547283 RepID=A0A1L3MNS7_9BACI|nr:FixH family protein [Bacillus weihaiensis]APH03995.1 hypothetical protein A9C19_04165 [Bacillus weihaiensis]
MKMKVLLTIAITGMLLLTGCQNKDEETNSHSVHEDSSDVVKTPKVEIIGSEHVDPNKEATIGANVYYGEDLVDDAEVTFEITDPAGASEKIEAALIENGYYEVTYTFIENGIYEVIAHTNVKSYHTMPKMTVQVGEGHSEKGEVERESGHEHHHRSIEVITDDLTGFIFNKEQQLTTTILENDQPFPHAKVRFEIWANGEEKHEFIDANEGEEEGTYQSLYTFRKTGEYNITVHVEKEEIHEHVELHVDVKEE